MGKKEKNTSYVESIAMDLFYVLENVWQYMAGWKKNQSS